MEHPQKKEERLASPSVLTHIAQILLIASLFIVPLFALPISVASLSLAKLSIITITVMGALLLWSVDRLRGGFFEYPHASIVWALMLLVLGSLLSTLVSGNILRSLLGQGVERDTTLVLFVFVAAALAVPLVFRRAIALARLQQAMLFSFMFLALLHILRLVLGADIVLPSLFSADPTATLLGSWNDLAVFAGFVVLVATMNIVSGVRLAKYYRLFLYASIAVGLFLLVIINLSSVWALLALFSFLIAAYGISAHRFSGAQEEEGEKGSVVWGRVAPSIITFVVSVLFLLMSPSVTDRIATVFSIAHIDVRPSWEGTVEVGSSVYQENALFGTGPNTFAQNWVLYKPEGVNETTFWDVDFNFGVGLIPTAFITTGIIGGILWLLFLGAFAFLGLRIMRAHITNPHVKNVLMSSYVGAAFLWLLSVVYVPHVAMLFTAFMVTGICIAGAMLSRSIRLHRIDGTHSSFNNVLVVGVSGVVVAVSFTAVAVSLMHLYAAKHLSTIVSVAQSGDIASAQTLLEYKGFGAGTQYERVAVNVHATALANVLQETDDADASTDQRAAFQEQLSRTIAAAQAAVAKDPDDYRNIVLLGSVYEQLVPLGIEGAYENAKSTYEQAREKNPTNPSIPLRLARLVLATGDVTTARAYIDEAIALKKDYADAYFLLSQIEIREGNVQAAIASSESAAILSPNNVGLLFQLGVLQYGAGAYENAAAVLERAITINPRYANALYFLGLSYEKLGKKENALVMLGQVAQLNPTNQEVAGLIEALQNGVSVDAALQQQGAPGIPERATVPVSEGIGNTL